VRLLTVPALVTVDVSRREIANKPTIEWMEMADDVLPVSPTTTCYVNRRSLEPLPTSTNTEENLARRSNKLIR
jgi:hypothetical protein